MAQVVLGKLGLYPHVAERDQGHHRLPRTGKGTDINVQIRDFTAVGSAHKRALQIQLCLLDTSARNLEDGIFLA